MQRGVGGDPGCMSMLAIVAMMADHGSRPMPARSKSRAFDCVDVRLGLLSVVIMLMVACSDGAVTEADSAADSPSSTASVIEEEEAPPHPITSTADLTARPLSGDWAKVSTSLRVSELVPLLVPFDDRLFILFPQNSGNDVTGEIYDPATDTAVRMADSNQVWRYNPAVVWTGHELLMVGGNNGPGIGDVALAYEPTADRWRTLPEPPDDLDALDDGIGGPGVWTGTVLLMWQQGLSFDPKTGTWTSIADYPGPRRVSPAMIWTGHEIVVWGGCDASIPQCDDLGSGLLTDGVIYDVATDSWRPMAASPLAAGVHPIGVLADSELLLYAGRTEPDDPRAQVASYDPGTDIWIELPDPPFEPRRYATGAWTGDWFVVWGGERTGESWYDDGAAYDPQAKTWIPLPEPPPGSARDRHAMAWIDDRLYIVGGWRTNGPLSFTPALNNDEATGQGD